MIRVLGLDPGFASCGYAEIVLAPRERSEMKTSVERLGVLRTQKSAKKKSMLVADDNTRRARELSALLGMMIGDSDIVCAESLSHPRVKRANGQWTIAVATSCQNSMTWGVVVALAQHERKPLLQASPQEIRKRIGLEKKASKNDISDAMLKLFGEPALMELLSSVTSSQRVHAFDALAAAVACLDTDEIRLLLAR